MSDRLPRTLLRTEGLVVALAALAVYIDGDHSWWLLVVLALAPDLSAVGFAAGPAIGAVSYDLAHTYAIPVVLTAVGVVADREIALQVGLIWAMHIGIDRAVGYGLKYPSRPKETHLQRV